MRGFPLTVSKGMMKNLLGQLRPEDRFNVVLFAGATAVLSDRSLPATQENIDQAWTLVKGQEGGGGTRLLAGLRSAFNLPLAGEGYARIVVVLTDGFIDFEAAAFKLVRQRLGQASLFAFGIGSSVNRFAIEGLARAGQGEPFVVLEEGQAPDEAARFQTYISSPILTQVETGFEGFDAYEVEPAFIPDMLADRPIIVFGKWRGAAAGTVLLGGRTGDQAYGAQFDVSTVQAKPTNRALRYLWARYRIDQLSYDEQLSYSDALRPQITQLGLDYNLLTKFTSFVAIDRRIRNGDGLETVSVPLPLPEGVEDSAVGDPFGTTAVEDEFEVATWLDRSFYRQDALWDNLTGQIVRVLTDGHLAAGAYVLAWDGRDGNGEEAASGVYIYRLEGTSLAITRRMMLLR